MRQEERMRKTSLLTWLSLLALCALSICSAETILPEPSPACESAAGQQVLLTAGDIEAVSYTHLTLPTT